jgi:uncharacterized membrane protein
MCRPTHAYLFGIALVALWVALGLIAHVAVTVEPCHPSAEAIRDLRISALETSIAMLQTRINWMQTIPELDRPRKYESLRAQHHGYRRALFQLQRERLECFWP